MSRQPEARRLADALDLAVKQTDAEDDVVLVARWFVADSASELRRLHAQRDELLAALKDMLPGAEAMGWNTDKSRAAIAKVEGDPK